ncbi:MAG: hypothetical protein U0T11_08575 [Chitinophagaceae bacterium]
MKYTSFLFAFLFLLLNYGTIAQTRLLVVQQPDAQVAIIHPKTKKVTAVIPTGFKPHEITCDPVSGLCFISDFGVEDYDTRLGIPGKTITVIDPILQIKTATIQTTTDTAGNMPHGIKIRPGTQRELFVNAERPDSMLVFDAVSFKRLRTYSLPKGTHNFLFSPDGKRLWLMCGTAGVMEIDPANGAILHQQITGTPVRGLSWIGPNLLASCNNELYVLSPNDLSVQQHFTQLNVGQIFYSVVDWNRKIIICPAAFDHTVLLIHAVTGEVLARIPTPKTPLQVELMNGVAYITHPLDEKMTMIDLNQKKIIGYLPVKGGNGIMLFKKQSGGK